MRSSLCSRLSWHWSPWLEFFSLPRGRRSAIGAASLLLGCLIAAERPVARAADAPAKRPNLVVIMADDIGVECLSCYGSESHQTPNLDRLAAAGMRFEHAHSQPICTPSRVQLMTGLHNQRNYIRFGLLDPSSVTFGNVLRSAGYKTCIAGKWQLEGGFEGPGRFGFDNYCLWQLTRRPSRYPNPGLEIDGEARDFKEGQFGPDLVSDYINNFMAEHRDEPFFVYYPMIAPHWPFVPTPDHPDWDPTMWRDKANEPGGYRSPKYWDAMVRYTDKMVGKVVDQIDALGLTDNTLIIWTADNGTFESITTRFRGRDYVGGKGTTQDSGTHVGFLARWPGQIPSGSVSDSLVDLTDVFPTLLEAGGVERPESLPLDGTSLMPAFRGEPRDKSSIYCWYHRNGDRETASEHIRDQRYKLYHDGRFYDTVEDPSEQRDLAAEGIPPQAQAIHERLSEELALRRAVTKAADPIQNQKRALFK